MAFEDHYPTIMIKDTRTGRTYEAFVTYWDNEFMYFFRKSKRNKGGLYPETRQLFDYEVVISVSEERYHDEDAKQPTNNITPG